MDYYSFNNPRGMEGWVGQTIVDSLPTKWSLVYHRSGAERIKSASQRLTS